MTPSSHMRWYYKVQGRHTHVRVFMNGALCGTLTFRNEEFEGIRALRDETEVCISFINELLPQHTNPGPVTRKAGITPLRYGEHITPKDEANVF